MMQLCALITVTILAFATPSPRPAATHSAAPPPVPHWNQAIAMGQARLQQPFVVDGLQVAISRLTTTGQFPDGTAPDTGARTIEVEFWAHNPSNENVDFFERFYPYAELSDGSNTDGEGVSFYPLTTGNELGALTLKPDETMHARFYLEIPDNTSITQLIVFGPVDGAKTAVPTHT